VYLRERVDPVHGCLNESSQSAWTCHRVRIFEQRNFGHSRGKHATNAKFSN